MKRLSDYLMDFLYEHGVRHIFMLSGGGIMYLVDSLGRSGIGHVCCHHEQACAIAAQAYAMYKNSLSVCLVTTGPGGTNALTGAAAAFVDSTPVLFISGQVKRADFASSRGVRQYGAQENDIVSMARPATKYAVTVTEPEDIRYHLEKALFLALNGRRGPVWLDVPLDVQSAMIDETKLRGFEHGKEKLEHTAEAARSAKHSEMAAKAARRASDMLKQARRPLFLIGHGVLAAGAGERFLELQRKCALPVLCTWRALGVMDSGDPYFFGSPGLQAPRYSNLILQGADLLIIIGTRLDNMITAYSEQRFGMRARKIVVDIDERELKKLRLTDAEYFCCDAGEFIGAMLREEMEPSDTGSWLGFCRSLKERFPLLAERQAKPLCGVNLYRAAERISDYCSADDALVFSSTSRCNTAGHIAFKRKAGQRAVSSMGLGSMGFALPSAVGAHFASGKKRVVVLEGDGSLQLNIQELQTIRHYGVNAKIFVFSNGGYAAIKAMQDRNFGSRHVGCTEDSGVSMPSLERIALAYGLPFYRIESDGAIDDTVRAVMDSEGPAVCEILGDIDFDEIPKCISFVGADGKISSAALENPYPFLSERELKDIYGGL